MKEFTEICNENRTWEERRFQLVKELCSATLIKDGLSTVRGLHVNTIISAADAILEKLYPGDDLIKSDKVVKLKEAFGNSDGKLGDFNFDTEMWPLIHNAAQVEITEVEWNRDDEQSQLCFLKAQLLEKSALLPECTHAFVRLSYLSDKELPDDIMHFLREFAPKAERKVLTERRGYNRKAILVAIK